MRRHLENSDIENSTKYPTSTIQKCEGHEKQWKTKKLS